MQTKIVAAASTRDVPMKETWREGCHLAAPMPGSKRDRAIVGADGLHPQLGSNDVLMAACE
ncbi:MAG TPA: hypothetical protein VIJ65_09415 [Acidobacteriaceae bacterium]